MLLKTIPNTVLYKAQFRIGYAVCLIASASDEFQKFIKVSKNLMFLQQYNPEISAIQKLFTI